MITFIRKFYKANPEFLGNRERAILAAEDATVETWDSSDDCFRVYSESQNQSFVIAWSMNNRKRGSIVN
jgi:hypothetical protein